MLEGHHLVPLGGAGGQEGVRESLGTRRRCPGGSDSKEAPCSAGDLGSIPESGRSPGEGNGYPFEYSYKENLMDGGTWQATVERVTKSQT